MLTVVPTLTVILANCHPNPNPRYQFFMAENRVVLGIQLPHVPASEVNAIANEHWHALEPTLKARYTHMAKEDKKRFERERRAWAGEPELEIESEDEPEPASVLQAAVIKATVQPAITSYMAFRDVKKVEPKPWP